MRKKILRKPGQEGYPDLVCARCGTYAAEDSGTLVQEHCEFTLGTCRICGEVRIKISPPSDFGWPIFYTYENGAPVRR